MPTQPEAIILGDNYELSFTDRRGNLHQRNVAMPVLEWRKPPQKEPGSFDVRYRDGTKD
jgi:hypothetical protein